MTPQPAVLAILVLMLPLAAAALVWVPRLWGMRRSGSSAVDAEVAERWQDAVTTVASLLSFTAILGLAAMAHGAALRFQFALIDMYVDSLSMYFLLLVNLVVVVASFYVGPWWRRRADTSVINRALFYSLFNLFHFTMILVPMVSNLVVLWIGIELTTVTSTALIAAERGRKHFEAAWKYIVITSAGIIFALLGTLFLANAVPVRTSARPSMEWPDLVATATQLDPNVVRLSFLFILVGYGTKAGLAPMHTWLPDAHGEAPYPVSALLSGVLLKSALYAILRFFTITNASLRSANFTSTVLLLVGLLSLITATPLILKKNPFKRVLAYHSLEHMGIIAVGIGIGGPIALFGALLHVLNHGVTKSLMFLAYGNVQDNYPSVASSKHAEPELTEEQPNGSGPSSESPGGYVRRASKGQEQVYKGGEYQGVLKATPNTGLMLALGGLALVGSPPFSVFFSEFLILWGGVRLLLRSPSTWLTLSITIFVLSLVLIFGGLVRHLGDLLLGKPPEGVQKETKRQVIPLVLLLSIVVLLGIVVPDTGILDLQRLLNASVRIVCEGGCRP